MAIAISQADYWELFDTIEPIQPKSHPSDEFDITWKYPEQLGQGYWREIRLREGIELAIAQFHPQDSVTLQLPEREHCLEYSFLLPGGCNNSSDSPRFGRYTFYGSGIAPVETETWQDTANIEVNVHIDPALVIAWLGQSPDGVPAALQHLIPTAPQPYHVRSGTTTNAMHIALQQILSCPFYGVTKRMYLESKVWELLALLIEKELETASPLQPRPSLKPDDVDRIHQAKAILLQRFDDPPSLIELARLVGLNDCTLKRGFRQVFGQTAFGCLHDYRLDYARQLLEERRLNVSEIAQAIGFANRSYFAAAFRKKFGVSPREYLSSYRNSA